MSIVLLALGLLGACTTAPPEQRGAADPEPVPELTLNLPTDAPAPCDCEASSEPDRTFLERGLDALASEDYIEAVKYFQRYARLEKTALAAWESRLAIAYASILPRSPFFDPDGAEARYRELRAELGSFASPPASVAVLLGALEAQSVAQRHINELEGSNSVLREDLEKREQALRRLRELTLGEPGAPR